MERKAIFLAVGTGFLALVIGVLIGITVRGHVDDGGGGDRNGRDLSEPRME